MGLVHPRHVLDGEEGEGEGARGGFHPGERLALRIGDVQQVDMADAAQIAVGVDRGGVEQNDVLHLRRDRVAGRGVGRARGTGLGRIALAVVALDHQRMGGVDEVEVADRRRALGEAELEAVTGPVLLRRIEGHHPQEVTLGAAAGHQQRLFEHRPEQVGAGLQRHALVTARALHLIVLARLGRNLDAGGVGAGQNRAVKPRRDHVEDRAVARHMQQIGAEFLADPEGAVERLEAFRVEIGAGQITAVGAFIGDAERHLVVGVVQEDGFLAGHRAGGEIGRHAVEEQHRVGAVHLRAEAVVGQREPAAILGAVHREARHPLHRLADEGQGDAGLVAAIALADIAHHAHRRLVAGGAGELARDPQIARRIGGRRDERQRRQEGVAGERRREDLFGEGRGGQGGAGRQQGDLEGHRCLL
ncbi:hypothetical protein SDC9_37628 [bioreactor metagenome]|uniref:Uncharacterized protein n=1 Tax=bioreactor metagenome TaxID=1076179 RepID=A0A644VLW7_9ZZZZ